MDPILIPIIALAIPVVAITSRHKRQMAEIEVRRLEAEAALGGKTAGTPEQHRELEDLRERVKVLERIATDERAPRRLAAEIESLRDN